MSYSENKPALRINSLDRRLLLNQDEIEELSKKIQQLFLTAFNFENKNISCFASISSKNEVQTFPLINEISTKNHVYLPVSDFSNCSMNHWLFKPGDALIESPYGIPEPEQRQVSLNPELFDVIIIPLLVADLMGHRIGYGKGFYDRFLKQCRPKALKIGLDFFDPIDRIPATSNDIPLDYLVTPEKCYGFQ